MLDLGKLHLLLEELKQNDIGITGLSEVRWSGEGLFNCGDHTIIYCGKDGGQSGVAIALNKHFAAALKSYNTISDRLVMIKLNTKPVTLNIIQAYAPTSASTEDDIEQFYNDLQAAKDMVPSRETCIVMGDFNAKVGEGEDLECGIGPYGLGERNDRGDMLATFCQANELCVTNTLFKQPKRRRYTWVSPGDRTRNQIDFILIDNAWKSTVLNSKTRPGVDCDTDHILVTANLRLKAYRQNKPKPHAKYDTDKLKDPEIAKTFETEAHNRFLPLLEEWSAVEKCPDELWADMFKIWTDTAETKLGKRKRKPGKPYISDEVMELAKRKSEARKQKNWIEHKQLKREIQSKLRRDEKDYLEKECAKVTECNQERKSREMFEQITKIKTTSTIKAQNQCISNKKGETLTETKDILTRWHEYGTDLFVTNTKTTDTKSPTAKNSEPEPEPTQAEILEAIGQLKNGKSPGLDRIPSEILKHTGEAGEKAIHFLISKIWKSHDWPSEWKLQEFIMLHKSGNPKDCNNYRTIALISHTSKILLIIILNRLKGKMEQEISDCQAGYRKNRGTTDMLFVLQLLIEKLRQNNEEAYVTFIDYSKAFDSVIHEQLFDIMEKMGFPSHLTSLISSLYKDQKATIRWNNANSDFFNIEKGVRQGCILSPHLFNIYTEHTMRMSEIEGMGIAIGDRNLTNLRYADDTALLADNITSMKRILHRVDTAGKKAGLELNAKKTKVMQLNNEKTHSIRLNKTDLENVEDFKYLGSIKSHDGSCNKDIRTRLGMAKHRMTQLNKLWKNRGIPLDLKVKILKVLVWPVCIYGCEAWTLKKADEKKIQAAEMWFYRRLLRIKWTDKRTNQSILDQLKTSRLLLNEINKRKLKYLGHAIRNEKTTLMKTAFSGKVEGKGRRGRPYKSYMENITQMTGIKKTKTIIKKGKDRDAWRSLVGQSLAAANIDTGSADPDDADR